MIVSITILCRNFLVFCEHLKINTHKDEFLISFALVKKRQLTHEISMVQLLFFEDIFCFKENVGINCLIVL